MVVGKTALSDISNRPKIPAEKYPAENGLDDVPILIVSPDAGYIS